MKLSFSAALRALTFSLCAVVFVLNTTAQAIQDKDKTAQSNAPKVSADEQKALDKVQSAKDVDAKMKAAGEYLKKYPTGVRRYDLAQYMAGEIAKTPDTNKQIALSETYLSLFTDAKEAPVIAKVLLDAYIKNNKTDDAFKAGAMLLQKNPNDVVTLTSMVVIGTNEAKQQINTHVQQTQTYGTKAIELMESDKMPDNFTAETWAKYKTDWLPQVYQSIGLLSFLYGDKEEARTRFTKSSSLNPQEPFNYVMLGVMADEEYRKLADVYKTLMSGKVKDDTNAKMKTKLEEIIDDFAHAVALSEGKAPYQTLHDQAMQNLQQYYQFRYGNTNGLQELINKYKK